MASFTQTLRCADCGTMFTQSIVETSVVCESCVPVATVPAWERRMPKNAVVSNLRGGTRSYARTDGIF